MSHLDKNPERVVTGVSIRPMPGLLVALLLPLAACAPRAARPTVEIPLLVQCNRDSYLVGDPIWLRLTLKNTTSERFRLEFGGDGDTPITVTCAGRRYRRPGPRKPPDLVFPDIDWVAEMAPGASSMQKIFLDEWTVFHKPGEYPLRVCLNWPCPRGLLGPSLRASGDVVVRIAARPPGDRPPLEAFDLEVMPEKDHFMVGEPIWLALRFRNRSIHVHHIDTGFLGRTRLSVRYGGEWRESEYLETVQGCLSGIYDADLGPGEAFEHKILLNEWVMFRKPGRYPVSVRFDSWKERVVGGEQPHLMAVGDALIEVRPKDSAELTRILRRDCDKDEFLTVCFSGQDEALPFLEGLAGPERRGFHSTDLEIEGVKGVGRVATLRALDLLAKWMKDKDELVADMATAQAYIIRERTHDTEVRRRAAGLLRGLPRDYKPDMPVISD